MKTGASIWTMFISVSVLGVSTLSGAQSLGDVARQHAAEKVDAKKPVTHVITEEDLPKFSASTINVVGSPRPASGASRPTGTDSGAPNEAVPANSKAKKPGQGFRYTVSWSAIPDVMDAAVFRFTVPEVATKNGSVALADVDIVANPCTSGRPTDPSPQLYANHSVHIFLACAGLNTKGRGSVGLARLIGELAPLDGKKPGQYSFKGALGYYAAYRSEKPGSGNGAVELRYVTTGTLEIEALKGP